eukprot:716144_1
MNPRHKNKWNSQRISKRFKNRHQPHLNSKCMISKENVNLYIKHYKHNTSASIIDDTFYPSNDNIPSWSCNRCTFYNTENNSYCSICEYPFNSNINTPSNSNNNNTQITMSDYLQPILTQIESTQDDYDQQIQFAIALSLHNSTDSDDTDDNTSISTSNSNNNASNNKPKKRQNKKRFHSRGITFAVYWKEMTEYNTIFQKNLKYIIKQNKLRMKTDTDTINTLWPNHGKISTDAYNIMKRNSILMDAVPTINKINEWLSTRWNVRDFKIQNIISAAVLNKFIGYGGVKRTRLQIVYHGTRCCNDRSIIQNGLVVGGTKGVPVVNGSAYGRGIYCSPSLSTASSYQRGSLFICLVRSNKCKKK